MSKSFLSLPRRLHQSWRQTAALLKLNYQENLLHSPQPPSGTPASISSSQQTHAHTFPTHTLFHASEAKSFDPHTYERKLAPKDLVALLEGSGFTTRARMRAMRFFIGRLRTRFIRRFLLRGTTLAPGIGAIFAFKSALGEFRRCRDEIGSESSRLRIRVPALLGAAGMLDAVNGCILTANTVRAVEGLFGSGSAGLTATPEMVEHSLNLLHQAAHAIAPFTPPSVSLVLASGAMISAVYGEILADARATMGTMQAKAMVAPVIDCNR